MKHESRTIGQSRTWARALCGQLERTWWPCETLLDRFQEWDAAARECKGKSDFYAFTRHGRRYAGILIQRDKALGELLRPDASDRKDS